MRFLGGIGLKVWGYVAAAGGFMLAVLMFWNKAKNAGRKEVKDAVNAKTTKVFKEIIDDDKKVEKDNRSLSDDDRRTKLRKYSRDSNNK